LRWHSNRCQGGGVLFETGGVPANCGFFSCSVRFYDPLISHQKIRTLLPTQQVLLGAMLRGELESTRCSTHPTQHSPVPA
jgi:hypothetical protein